jgi:uracil-DNA glycosylase family 4
VADSLDLVRREVVACTRCPRLVRYRERVAREKKREFQRDEYWGRPVPGFGDPAARLVAVGLAPAAHGSNRTGRVFTGDRSAAFLVRAFHAAGFANQPTSLRRGDGLRYRDLYLTAALRCAPPDNRPTPEERTNCAPYLERELRLLPETRAILALGGVAWDAVRDVVSRVYGIERPTGAFAHGACLPLGPGRPMLWGSYHPSPQNTNTGKLTFPMLVDLLQRIRGSYELSGGPATRHP